MYSKDSLLRLSFLINLGGGGKVKGSPARRTCALCKANSVTKAFVSLKKKKKAHMERKMLASRDEATGYSLLCVGIKLHSAFLINYTTSC